HVLIVGGGFGGLTAARALRDAPVRVTLVDRRNFHLFQPLLYQVATGALSPANIAAPLRAVLAGQRNAAVIMAQATGIDAIGKRLLLADGELSYDSLIVATGSTHHYFGNDRWAALAPGLKTIEDATEIRRKVLLAFERAERSQDPEERLALLTFVVVGGGPTGVELAGAVAEIARWSLRGEFAHIDTTSARVVLVENSERVLGTFPADLAAKAQRSLERIGVEVRTGTRMTDLQADAVELTNAAGAQRLATRTVLWAAGVKASALGQAVADATGVPLDRAGRVLVGPDCSVPGHPDLFVIGDLAGMLREDGKPVPGVAPAAVQQGTYVARVIAERLTGGAPPPPFRYKDKGSLATIGRNHAIADLGWCRISGFIAWLAWLFIHILYLVTFQSRVLVLIQWAWNYVSRDRAARLITGKDDGQP
ncbi:MAG: NAD(P)/FAD-dependent oxidoreductase, partial [Planctomycetes bacterium]|nr:NAD(P)/FAD-dependent oxidoreductase [Planctomycetota bacterium]